MWFTDVSGFPVKPYKTNQSCKASALLHRFSKFLIATTFLLESICALTQMETILSIQCRERFQILCCDPCFNILGLVRVDQCHAAAFEACAGEAATVDAIGISHTPKNWTHKPDALPGYGLHRKNGGRLPECYKSQSSLLPHKHQGS